MENRASWREEPPSVTAQRSDWPRGDQLARTPRLWSAPLDKGSQNKNVQSHCPLNRPRRIIPELNLEKNCRIVGILRSCRAPFSGGCPFVFYDGHVQMITYNANITNTGGIYPLLTTNGGEVISGL